MNKKKVFIVEDNDLNLKLFNDILISNGYDTSFTSNGFEALDKIEKYQPNAIIMDIQLQGISGFDIIKLLKKHGRLRNIPVIAVTAFAMKDDKTKILNSGFVSYVAKPISIMPFLNLIESFVHEQESIAT